MTPWKRNAAIALGALISIAGAFSAGRFSAPLEVQTKEVEKLVYQDRVVEKVVTVEVKARAETKIVYRDRIVTKEGTVTEHIVERTDTKEDTKANSTAESTSTVAVETSVIKERTEILRPQWRVGVLAGASLSKPFVPVAGPLVLGLQVDLRIVGGLSLGVWVNTVGAAGGAVSLEF